MKICSIDGCGNKFKGNGYCNKHLIQFYRHGNPLAKERDYNWTKGANNPQWKGGVSHNTKFYSQKYRSEHRKQCVKNTSKYYVLMKNAGELTIQTIQRVYEDNIKQHGTLTCYLCLKPIEFKQDSLEHKTPISRGGTNNYDNLAIAHRNCNCSKNTKTEEEYRRHIAVLI